MLLKDAWEQEAKNWTDWARMPGHDSYWRFHKEQFFSLLPDPGRLTVDIGCGEGRVTRDLKALGHKVVAVDASPTLVDFARQADPHGDYRHADAANLPFDDCCADLAIAFMSMQDVDDLERSIAEMQRILVPNGRACLAIVHPINSVGNFSNEEVESPFVITRNYFEEFRYSDTLAREGMQMTFHSIHRTLETFSRVFEQTGFLIERIRETTVTEAGLRGDASKRWLRLPLFLHLRLVKAAIL